MSHPPSKRNTVPLSEMLSMIVLCFGWFILVSILSVELNLVPEGFADTDFAFMIGFEIATGGVALWILRRRGHVLADLLPKPSGLGVLLGVGIYLVATVASLFVAQVLLPEMPNQPIEVMVEQAQVTLPMVVLLALVNGLYEELFLLGYIQRFMMGHGASFALGVSLLVRLLYHLYQGPSGAVFVLIFGGTLGYVYLRTGNLWAVVVAHIVADIVPFLGAV
jgi:membrane protease YdiL (CAAX protease family)